MVYKPAEEDVRWVATFVATLVAVTVALGTTAPLLSVTVPEMVPSPAVWASSATGVAIVIAATNRAATNRKIVLQSVLARLPRSMFFGESMMTSIEINSVNELRGLRARHVSNRTTSRN